MGSRALSCRGADASALQASQYRPSLSLFPVLQHRLYRDAIRGRPELQELAYEPRTRAPSGGARSHITAVARSARAYPRSDFLHRDIAPDNIIIRRDGTPVLIDFGSARGEIASHTKTLSALVKPGYSPYEQYATTGVRQGPWTDIYSLAATLYHAMTGKRPTDAPSRMVVDELISVRSAALASYRPGFLAAIDRGLRLDINKRPKSIAVWRDELTAVAIKTHTKASSRPRAAAVAPMSAQSSTDARPVTDVAPGLALKVTNAGSMKGEAMQPHAGLPEATSVSAKAGLVGAFLDGWRKGPKDPGAETDQRADAIASSSSAAGSHHRSGEYFWGRQCGRDDSSCKGSGRAGSSLSPAMDSKASETADATVTATFDEQKRTSRTLRGQPKWRWTSMAFKLAIGAGVAAVAVTLQDQLPRGASAPDMLESGRNEPRADGSRP